MLFSNIVSSLYFWRIRFSRLLWLRCRGMIHIGGIFSCSWLAAPIVVLTPALQDFISWGRLSWTSTNGSHSLSISSMSSLAFLAPPSICLYITCCLNGTTIFLCPNIREAFFLLKRPVTRPYCGHILSDIDIAHLSDHSLVGSSLSMAKFHWHGAWPFIQKSCTHDQGLVREVAGCENWL